MNELFYIIIGIKKGKKTAETSARVFYYSIFFSNSLCYFKKIGDHRLIFFWFKIKNLESLPDSLGGFKLLSTKNILYSIEIWAFYNMNYRVWPNIYLFSSRKYTINFKIFNFIFKILLKLKFTFYEWSPHYYVWYIQVNWPV